MLPPTVRVLVVVSYVHVPLFRLPKVPLISPAACTAVSGTPNTKIDVNIIAAAVTAAEIFLKTLFI